MLLFTWVLFCVCQVSYISGLYDITTFYYIGKIFNGTEEQNLVEVHLRTNALGLPVEDGINLRELTYTNDFIKWQTVGWRLSLSQTALLNDVQVLKETPVDTTFLPLIGFNSTIALKLNGYIDYGSIYFILTPANTLLRQMDFFYFIDVRIGLYIEGVYYNMFSLNSLSIERCVASSESNPTFTDIDDIEFHVNCTTMLYAYDIKWEFQYLAINNFLRIDTSNKVIKIWDSEEFKFPYEAWEDRIPIALTCYEDNTELKYFSMKIGKIRSEISGLRTHLQFPTVLSTSEQNQILESPWFNYSTYTTLCITAVIYAELQPKPTISVFVESKTQNIVYLGKIETSVMGWQISRLFAPLPNDMNSSELRILLAVISEKEFHIQRIAFTNAEDQEDVFTFKFDSNDISYVPFDVQLWMKEQIITNRTDCKNGGKGIGDECACPPGFIGEFCDQGCGQNHYGSDCEGICSTRIPECRGLLLCVPDLGCNCASGYTGETCEESCVKGKYGVNCSENCGECKDDCNVYTGDCVECKPGYIPPFCTQTYARLQFGPTVTSVAYTKVTVIPNFTKPFLGEGSPLIYQVQYKESLANSWKIHSNNMLPENNSEVSSTLLDSLKPGIQYMVRVVLIDDDSYQGDLVPFTNFTTLCQVSHNNNLNLNASTNETAFSLTWNLVNVRKYDCPVKYYELYWKEAWRTVSRLFTNSSTILSDRLPGTRFKVQIRAHTTNGTTPYSKVNEVVLKLPEPGPVRYLRFIMLDNNSVKISWEKPLNSGRRAINYTVKYKCEERLPCGMPCSNSSGEFQVISTNVTLTSLLPASYYSASVSTDRKTKRNLRFITKFTAPPEVPELDNSKVPIKTPTQITVFLKHQNVCSGFFKGYFYQIFQANNRSTIISEGTSNSTEIRIGNLTSSTDYALLIYVVTSNRVSNKFMEYFVSTSNNSDYIQEVEGLFNVSVLNSTSTSFCLKWNYAYEVEEPRLSFWLVVKETESFNQTRCCQTYPGILINVKKNLPYYTVEVLNLNPASKHIANLQTKSIHNEASKSLIICTKPPHIPVLYLPHVKINTSDSWTWLTQNLHHEVSEEPLMYSSLIIGNLLLVLSNKTFMEEEVIEEYISQELRNLTNDSFYFAAVYKNNEVIDLGSGNNNNVSEWGRPHNSPLLSNVTYYLAAVQITSYCGLYSVDIVFSSPFTKL